MTQDGFTNKEMLERILNKLDKMESQINSTHELATNTSSKVKFHTKVINGIIGFVIGLSGWFISYLISGKTFGLVISYLI